MPLSGQKLYQDHKFLTKRYAIVIQLDALELNIVNILRLSSKIWRIQL